MTAHLASEIASGIYDIGTICKNFGLTYEEMRHLLENEHFKQMIRGASQQWNASDNAAERIRAKAEIAIEDSIIMLHTLAHNPELPTGARLEATKQLSNLAGTNNRSKETGAGGGQGFSITINLGDPEKDVTIAGDQSKPVVIDQEANK